MITHAYDIITQNQDSYVYHFHTMDLQIFSSVQIYSKARNNNCDFRGKSTDLK